MSAPTITMISLTGREPLTEETIDTLNVRGSMSGYRFDLFYFVAPGDEAKVLTLPDNCELHVGASGGMMPDFWRLLAWVPPDADWIFLEDDVFPCRNAVRKMAELEVPDDIGVISFFDLRNEWDTPGVWRNKLWDDEAKGKRRHLYGTQAVKIPARVVPALKQLGAERRRFSANWDTWLGLALDFLGLRVAHYAPSLVQHTGMVSVAYPQTTDARPLTHNFPGEDFDALGPCPSPIPSGEWMRNHLFKRGCPLHGEFHPFGFLCPQLIP